MLLECPVYDSIRDTFMVELEKPLGGGGGGGGLRSLVHSIIIIIIIIIYSCCCRSAYAIDHAPTDAGGACKTSSQRTRARTTRDHTILITIQFLLPSLPYQ